MYKKIKLTQGKFAIVDNEDFEWLNKHKWYFNAQGYAVREQNISPNKSIMIRMHRIINSTPKGMDTDHINRNPLDNRRCNLRTLTHSKNMFNLKKNINNKSGFTGIQWFKESKKWRAYINLKGRQIHLGLYKDIKSAIKIRKEAERTYHAI